MPLWDSQLKATNTRKMVFRTAKCDIRRHLKLLAKS